MIISVTRYSPKNLIINKVKGSRFVVDLFLVNDGCLNYLMFAGYTVSRRHNHEKDNHLVYVGVDVGLSR